MVWGGDRSRMIRAIVARLREWIAVEDADERIVGSGEVILDPAYNGRYEAERELKRFSRVEEADRSDDP